MGYVIGRPRDVMGGRLRVVFLVIGMHDYEIGDGERRVDGGGRFRRDLRRW